jgi:hypothetical protein
MLFIMKTVLLSVCLGLLSAMANAQSESFRILKDQFRGEKDVYSFAMGGWACRWVLNIVGEPEFKSAIEEVKHVRLMVIPIKEFHRQSLTPKGFRNVLKDDGYEELARIKEPNEDVFIYIKENDNRKNYYFVLVDDSHEVVAIELQGYINPGKLRKPLLSYQY